MTVILHLHQNDKKIKNSKGNEFNSATKSKETRNKILDERTFWHEILYGAKFRRGKY